MRLTVLAAQLAAPLLLHLVALVQRQLLPKLPVDSSPHGLEAEAELEADELVPLQLLAEFARRSTKAVAPVKPRRTSSKPIVRFCFSLATPHLVHACMRYRILRPTRFQTCAAL